MSNDVFGQLCFFMFVTAPVSEEKVRDKRIKLATVYCHRSVCDDYIESFRTHNPDLSGKVVVEFSTREML
jgi:hypothetical protein